MNKTTLLAAVAGLSLLLAGALAAPRHSMNPGTSGEFQRIEQPLSHKLAVTLGGLGLISLELWWFLGSKPQPVPRKGDSHRSKNLNR